MKSYELATYSVTKEIKDKLTCLNKLTGIPRSFIVRKALNKIFQKFSFCDDGGITDLDSLVQFYPDDRKGEIIPNLTEE